LGRKGAEREQSRRRDELQRRSDGPPAQAALHGVSLEPVGAEGGAQDAGDAHEGGETLERHRGRVGFSLRPGWERRRAAVARAETRSEARRSAERAPLASKGWVRRCWTVEARRALSLARRGPAEA